QDWSAQDSRVAEPGRARTWTGVRHPPVSRCGARSGCRAARCPGAASARLGDNNEKTVKWSVHDLEFLNPLPPVFGDVDVSFGVHGNAVRLVELAGEVPDAAAEMRNDATGLAIDDLDLRVVLIDEIDQRLDRIAG